MIPLECGFLVQTKTSMADQHHAAKTTTMPSIKKKKAARKFTRCASLVREQRARICIFRRCATMLLCWYIQGDKQIDLYQKKKKETSRQKRWPNYNISIYISCLLHFHWSFSNIVWYGEISTCDICLSSSSYCPNFFTSLAASHGVYWAVREACQAYGECQAFLPNQFREE